MPWVPLILSGRPFFKHPQSDQGAASTNFCVPRRRKCKLLQFPLSTNNLSDSPPPPPPRRALSFLSLSILTSLVFPPVLSPTASTNLSARKRIPGYVVSTPFYRKVSFHFSPTTTQFSPTRSAKDPPLPVSEWVYGLLPRRPHHPKCHYSVLSL